MSELLSLARKITISAQYVEYADPADGMLCDGLESLAGLNTEMAKNEACVEPNHFNARQYLAYGLFEYTSGKNDLEISCCLEDYGIKVLRSWLKG